MESLDPTEDPFCTSVRISPNMAKDPVIAINTMYVMMGFKRGRVIYQNSFHLLAPSILAASPNSAGIPYQQNRRHGPKRIT